MSRIIMPENSILYVCRGDLPEYPATWKKDVIDQELEKIGPDLFDVRELGSYVHPEQAKGGLARGTTIYKYLYMIERAKQKAKKKAEQEGKKFEGNGDEGLASCFSGVDLDAIYDEDFEFFMAHFFGDILVGLKTMIRDNRGDLNVPCLLEYGGRLKKDWILLKGLWSLRHRVLRYKKGQVILGSKTHDLGSDQLGFFVENSHNGSRGSNLPILQGS